MAVVRVGRWCRGARPIGLVVVVRRAIAVELVARRALELVELELGRLVLLEGGSGIVQEWMIVIERVGVVRIVIVIVFEGEMSGLLVGSLIEQLDDVVLREVGVGAAYLSLTARRHQIESLNVDRWRWRARRVLLLVRLLVFGREVEQRALRVVRSQLVRRGHGRTGALARRRRAARYQSQRVVQTRRRVGRGAGARRQLALDVVEVRVVVT